MNIIAELKSAVALLRHCGSTTPSSNIGRKIRPGLESQRRKESLELLAEKVRVINSDNRSPGARHYRALRAEAEKLPEALCIMRVNIKETRRLHRLLNGSDE